MDFSPIINASVAIQVHLCFALVAVVVFVLVISVKRGGRVHRVMGRVWVMVMVITAVSSFWIMEIDHFMGFSAIHLLSIFTLVNCYRGVAAIRAGRVIAHRNAMIGTALGGLLIAGLFSFAPGRIMHQIFISGAI